jgi:hypothetical protein
VPSIKKKMGVPVYRLLPVNEGQAVRNEPLLHAVARRTALDIVNRHAKDCPNRDALIEAVAHLARRALEGHVRLYVSHHLYPSGTQAPETL